MQSLEWMVFWYRCIACVCNFIMEQFCSCISSGWFLSNESLQNLWQLRNIALFILWFHKQFHVSLPIQCQIVIMICWTRPIFNASCLYIVICLMAQLLQVLVYMIKPRYVGLQEFVANIGMISHCDHMVWIVLMFVST